MRADQDQVTEAARLERLWGGEFGDTYVERNRAAGNTRGPFWQMIMAGFNVTSALEVGCNVGANLTWITPQLPSHSVFGIDINLTALKELRRHVPGAGVLLAPARQLPFRDRSFQMVFTMGVLIHQPEDTLPSVMAEIVRCSNRYILCGEYYSERTTEVFYRGQTGALFKRDYGQAYQQMFPGLQLRKQGFLSRDDGWDDVTYWLFEKQ